MALDKSVLRWWGRLLWRPLYGERSHLKRWAVIVARVLTMTFEGFRDNRLLLHASDLSFYVALSMVPFMAFVLLILKVVGLSNVVQPMLLVLVSAGNQRAAENLALFIANAQGTAVSGVGVVVMFTVGFMMLQRVKAALNHIWGISHTPRYSYRLIEYVVVLTLAPLVLATTFSLTTYLNSIRLGEALLLSGLPAEVYAWAIAYSSVPLFVVILLYAYLFLPDTNVRWPGALTGAIVSAVLIQAAQDLYIFAFVRLSAYNLIYGAFAVLPFLMIWFYLAWMLFLFGAQLSCAIQNYTVLLISRRRGTALTINRPYVVLAVLLEVVRVFQATGKPARLAAVAKHLGIARGAAAEELRHLAEAYLVTPLQDRRNSYVPAERMDKLTVGEALRRMEALPQFAEQPTMGQFARIDILRALFAETNRAMNVPLRALSIADLLGRMEQPTATDAHGQEPAEGSPQNVVRPPPTAAHPEASALPGEEDARAREIPGQQDRRASGR
ncbi:MAG: YihY/virulence factor BrkB family protein [Candidatus Lambdaproteobacteria bacterium]|nr:YihY/virulence factor BrkB family protein [Candidatus Lambdaproteobacteria bacterium]